jgi:hypothetical protein
LWQPFRLLIGDACSDGSIKQAVKAEALEEALIDGQPRSATVVATSDLVVLEIAQTDLRRLLKRARQWSESCSRRCHCACATPTPWSPAT